MVKISVETKRNLFHLVLGICIVALLYYNFINVWVMLAVVVVGFLLSMASRWRPVPIIHWFLIRFEREENMTSIPGRGALFFFVGLLIAMALFSHDVVLASATIFVLADSISPLIGVKVGRVPHPLSDKKFIEGSIGGFIFAFLGAMIFVSPVEALLATFFAVVVEAIDCVKGKRIEDNITIPLVAGITITLLRML
jgi:dolichol kinase